VELRSNVRDWLREARSWTSGSVFVGRLELGSKGVML